VLDVKRLADDTGRFGRSRDSIEHFLGVSLGVLLVFDWRVAEFGSARQRANGMEMAQ